MSRLLNLVKGAAAQGGDEDAQCHRSGGEDADDRVAGQPGAAADKVEKQGKDQGEEDGGPGGLGEAAKGTDGHAGEGGVAQGVGEKDIRLWTTMVDRMPNRGEMTSTASRAFFMKYMEPGWATQRAAGPPVRTRAPSCLSPFPTRRWKVS